MKNIILGIFVLCFLSTTALASDCCRQPVRNVVKSVVSVPVDVARSVVARSNTRREARQYRRYSRNTSCSCSPCLCN